MTVTFINSPLLEIVAEVRWNFAQPVPQWVQSGPFPSAPVFNQPFQFAFLDRLAPALFQRGFPLCEHLIPQGTHGAPFTVSHKFRAPDKASVFQVGPGVFTANAVPPYRAWHEFEPMVRDGIDALLASRQGDEASAPFLQVTLRYINAFRAVHIGNRSAQAFMRDVLGIFANVPPIVAKHAKDRSPSHEMVQVRLPLGGGLQLALFATEGFTATGPGLIFDLTVQTVDGHVTPPSDALDVFARAHDIIHDIFFESTRLIRDVLKPEEIPL